MRDVRILEIGDVQDAALRMWYDYFPHGSIYAFGPRDLREACNDRITAFVGDPADRHHVNWFLAQSGGQFDIVLDRSGHGALEALLSSVNPGGFYVLEDFRRERLTPEGAAMLDEQVAGTTMECHGSLAILRIPAGEGPPATAPDARDEPVLVDPGAFDLLSGMRFDADGEPVYALMVTGKDRFHRRLARNAVVNFLAQTYGNRILVIVNDGDFDVMVAGVPPDRVVQVRPDGRLPLGRLRNLALDAVPDAALWVQWDDDDWRHPSLMDDQVRVLEATDSHACFLRRQVKVALSRNASWVDVSAGGFSGTVMSRKAAALRYPETARGEDTVFGLALKQRYPWTAWDNVPHAYLRFIHGHNTWVDSHFRLDERAPHEWMLPVESAGYVDSVLPLYRDAGA